MNDYTRFLSATDLFRNLSNSDIMKLNSVCLEEEFEAGRVIFDEGSLAERLYIVMDGSVEIWKDYNTEKQDLLAVHGVGRMFGEMALLDNLPRSATVLTREKSRLLFIERKGFNKIISDNSSISLSIARSVSGMVRRSNDAFIESLRARNKQLEAANRELKATQDELLRAERLSAIGKFSSLILHDIRNPLGVIHGYAQLVREMPEDRDLVENRIEKIIEEADRLNDLVTELLDFCRGDMKLNMAPVHLDLFISDFIGEIYDKFKAHDIRIETRLVPDIKVFMDPRRMFRALNNLAGNSLKAMPGGGQFFLKTSTTGQYLKIEVEDTGVGMKPKQINRIFEPFFTSFECGGTGLGMTIVKSIVEAHDGTVNVKSIPNEGTCFSILIPRVE